METEKSIIEACPSPAVGECIFAFFRFETKLGRGRGIVNLTPTDKSGEHWKAFTIYTCLQELKGYEERVHDRRPRGVEKGETKNWLDQRKETETMENGEPTVVVIGAGHSGLNIAARLGMLDILTLVIDRNQRIGDNWRNRYKSYPSQMTMLTGRLVLHDPVWYDHLSYLPFPQHWPVFTPKGIISFIKTD
jgi:putative flavoprotein involved in K+ transport